MATTIPKKEALVVILDVGGSMSTPRKNAGKDAVPPLEAGLKAVNLLIQQKLVYGKSDEVGLVLCGTEGTDNPLSEDGYEHITVARELTCPDIDLVRFVENIAPSKYSGDLTDALIVAMDMLNRKTAGKRYQRRVFLVTDGGSPVNESDWTTIIANFKKMEAKLNLIGIDFQPDDELADQSKGKQQPKHPTSERLLRKLTNEVSGQVFAVHEALEVMSALRSRSIAQRTTFRGALEISPFLKIGVWSFTKCSEAKFPSLRQLSDVAMQSANPGECQVIRDQTYYSLSDPDLTIDRSEVVKAYKYGKSLIPFPNYDEKKMKYSAEKCMQLIGFTDSKSVPRHHLLGSIECVCAEPGNSHASLALSALIHALAETDSVAIIRYVPRNGGNAKLAVLTPVIKADYECLYLASLPFSEDLRQYQFAPLNLKNIKKRYKPDDDQLQAAQHLIDSLDLTQTGLEDSQGKPVEALKPLQTYHPSLQRFYQSVQYRAMNPNSPIPALDPIIEKYVNPDAELFAQAHKALKEVTAKFPLTKSEAAEKSSTRKLWGQAVDDEVRLESYVADSSAKKRKLEGQMGDFSLEKLVSIATNDVGSINPVQDFKDMLARRDVDLVDKAVEQMKGRITQLVNDSIRDQFYGKAIECLKALREGCMRETESEQFNAFLTKLKADYEGKRRDDFWRLLAPNGLTLIHCDEADDSSVTPEEAMAFLAPPQSYDSQTSQKTNKQPQGDDVDDLLDQIE